MTITQARRLQVGDGVVYSGTIRGVVLIVKMNSTVIQWADGPALDIPHDQMQLIEKESKWRNAKK